MRRGEERLRIEGNFANIKAEFLSDGELVKIREEKENKKEKKDLQKMKMK